MDLFTFIAFIVIGTFIYGVLDILDLHVFKYMLIFMVCIIEPIFIIGVIMIIMINENRLENDNQEQINRMELRRFDRYKERYC
jgi:undecaprenyl pyrophosphate phosphatase UppP